MRAVVDARARVSTCPTGHHRAVGLPPRSKRSGRRP
jgi:hypothetical protein